MDSRLICGDSAKELKKLGDNSIDLIVTDPPYGYSFMAKDWDKALPDKEIWIECLRVLKHGGFAYVMSSPRQDVLARMMIDLEDSGFNTAFTSMYWAYASGFPKALNMSKAVDKRLGVKADSAGVVKGMGKQNSEWNGKGVGGRKEDYFKPEYDKKLATSPQAKKLDGSYAGFQPKPAVEVIIVCMKPLDEKGYIDQALSNQKGVSWFDDCRIPYDSDDDMKGAKTGFVGKPILPPENGWNDNSVINNSKPNNMGRYPANLLVSDDVFNQFQDKGTKPHTLRSSEETNKRQLEKGWGSVTNPKGQMGNYGDSGSFSRYFDIDKWFESQFIITPKASKSEKNKGLDEFEEKFQANAEFRPNHLEDAKAGSSGKPHGRYTKTKNNHPTVKPIKLMSYLITLGSRKGDIVLDPFLGSGTTALACKNLDRKYIGIERDEEYFKICEARVKEGYKWF
jgi:site-specific DNA-methyltransferase (adenine-specific)